MKRLIVQTRLFSEDLDGLISEHKLLVGDYEEFERSLAKDPEQGDLIQGSGGFRVCYCDVPEKGKLFFILIYGKNEKENISQQDKKVFKKLIEKIKNE